MRIIIQKFGGTSVRSREDRVKAVAKIIKAKKSGYDPVVVVSAMGRLGEPYATDTLIQAMKEAAGGDMNAREQDMVMACGEILSAAVVASMLEAQGYAARALTGAQAGIYTDGRFGSAALLKPDPERLRTLLSEGIIPVVAGFQGVTRDGEITTLGRGGSDTSAVILGVMLRAEMTEIYTDVDGIMTADPALLPEARVLSGVSYAEVFQMADNGAKVIHPKAVELAMRGNIPLVVRNTFNEKPGTRISNYNDEGLGDVLVSVAHHANRAQITVDLKRPGEEAAVLQQLALQGISIDLINIFPEKMVFTIDQGLLGQAQDALDGMQTLYTLRRGCCKISAIGSAMHGVPGVTARIMQALAREGIAVLQSADSHMHISCLVDDSQTRAALRALHKEFHLELV
ncbi:MAG: aspartate kinase [Eubacteriales bacterium]|nr:aspartate kinase [Eubacteriales bacterium]